MSTRIKELREQKGFTQEELAERLDIGQSHLSRIENGIKIISFPLALQIAKVLEVDVGELV